MGAILWATTPLSSANNYEKKAIIFGTVIVKKLILWTWGSDTAPMYDLWLREMANMLHLERLRLYNEDKGGTDEDKGGKEKTNVPITVIISVLILFMFSVFC